MLLENLIHNRITLFPYHYKTAISLEIINEGVRIIRIFVSFVRERSGTFQSPASQFTTGTVANVPCNFPFCILRFDSSLT